jgi:hypothetical protein
MDDDDDVCRFHFQKRGKNGERSDGVTFTQTALVPSPEHHLLRAHTQHARTNEHASTECREQALLAHVGTPYVSCAALIR